MQNQKLIANSHIEFEYYEPTPNDGIRTSTMYKIENGDTTFISTITYDKKGQIIKRSQSDKTPNYRFVSIESEHYIYDDKGNITHVIDSMEGFSTEWLTLMYLKEKISNATNDEKKELQNYELELRNNNKQIPEKLEGEHKVFIYDADGYLTYFTNLGVGYKAVVGYRLDSKKRLAELTILDTNQRLNDRMRSIYLFYYDTLNRVIKRSKEFVSVTGKEDKFAHERAGKSEQYLTYDTSGKIRSVINKNDGQSDTTFYRYVYNNKKQLTAEITLNPKDTVSMIIYIYKNDLLVKEQNNYYTNKGSPAPDSERFLEYEYYPNGDLKNILHFTIYTEGEEKISILNSVENFEYTYYK
jgi:hypothetical protein